MTIQLMCYKPLNFQEIENLVNDRRPKVVQVLSQSEMLFLDSPDLLRDTGSLRTHLASLKRRWEGICGQTIERRQVIEDTWNEWQQMIKLHSELQAWIDDRYHCHKFNVILGILNNFYINNGSLLFGCSFMTFKLQSFVHMAVNEHARKHCLA